MIRQKLPLPVIDSTDGKLLVWVGGLDSWDPLLRDCCLGVPRLESQTIAPQTTNLPWDWSNAGLSKESDLKCQKIQVYEQ